MQSTDKPEMGYWNIRGRGAYVKLAFASVGVDYVYTGYAEPEADKWFKVDKPALAATSMTLPNLPYLKDGDVLITEHDAIFRHIFRKYKPEMLGTTLTEQAEVDQFLSYWTSVNVIVRGACYTISEPTEEARKALLEKFRYHLDRIDARLATRKFLLGDTLTAADVYMYETVQLFKVVHEATTKSWSNIVRVVDSIESLPFYEAYKNGPHYIDQMNGNDSFINNK
jgi:glutathione S-transferase